MASQIQGDRKAPMTNDPNDPNDVNDDNDPNDLNDDNDLNDVNGDNPCFIGYTSVANVLPETPSVLNPGCCRF